MMTFCTPKIEARFLWISSREASVQLENWARTPVFFRQLLRLAADMMTALGYMPTFCRTFSRAFRTVVMMSLDTVAQGAVPDTSVVSGAPVQVVVFWIAAATRRS